MLFPLFLNLALSIIVNLGFASDESPSLDCLVLAGKLRSAMDKEIKPEFGCIAPKLRIERSSDANGPYFILKSCTIKKTVEACVPMSLTYTKETSHSAFPELSEVLASKRESKFLASCEAVDGNCRKLLVGFNPQNFVDKPAYVYSEKMAPSAGIGGQLGLKQMSEVTVRISGKIRMPVERLVEMLVSADKSNPLNEGLLIKGVKAVKRKLLKNQLEAENFNKCQFQNSLKQLADPSSIGADFFHIWVSPLGKRSYCGGTYAIRLETMLMIDSLYNPNVIADSVRSTVNEGLGTAQPAIRKEFEKGAK